MGTKLSTYNIVIYISLNPFSPSTELGLKLQCGQGPHPTARRRQPVIRNQGADVLTDRWSLDSRARVSRRRRRRGIKTSWFSAMVARWL